VNDKKECSRQDLIEIQSEIWQSILVFCRELTPCDWESQTACPTWTVKDCFSHLIGIEARLLECPSPELEIKELRHVRNSQGLVNEIDVVSRRHKSNNELIEEFLEVTRKRIEYLHKSKDFSVKAESPIGIGTLSDQVSVRIFDCWVHLQDMRSAVGAQCEFSSKASEFSLSRIYSVLPFVIGKKVAPSDGTQVSFEIQGVINTTRKDVRMVGRRAHLVSDNNEFSVNLILSEETFFRLACGRVDPEFAIETNLVVFAGDVILGKKVVKQMNFMI